MIRAALTTAALTIAVLAAPANASVYAVQQEDGSWKVSKYDDGDATFKFTRRDMRKTIKVKKMVERKDFRKKNYTEKGEEKLAAYEQADEAWKNSGSGKFTNIDGIRKEVRTATLWCGSGGCNFPEPGEDGRPAKPKLEEGVDFEYGTKMVSELVDAPNPNYLQLMEPIVEFSDRAKKPGAMWLVGTTVNMTWDEFNQYLRYLR